MKPNVGTLDRIIRVIIAVVFSILYFTGTVSGTIGIVLLMLGGIFVLTSFMSICPIYLAFGISTCKTKN